MGASLDQSGTQTIATFTGTLLRREHALGQRFVQLVFREDDKNWLCLSSNLAHIAKLQIGKSYKIEGVFKQLGERPYIHEPQVTLSRSRARRLKRWSLCVAIVLVVAAGTAFAVRAVHGSLAPTSAETTAKHKIVATTSPEEDTAATVQETVPPAAETPAPDPVPAPAPKTTKKATTPVVAPPTAPAAALAPHCDDIVSTPLTPIITEDNTMPAGSENIEQVGIDQQTRTCYPDAGTANGTTEVLVPGQPLKKTVGTGTA